MTGDSSILIYQSLDKVQYDVYRNEIAEWIINTSRIPMLHIDSFSSIEVFQGAKQMIAESENCLVIVLLAEHGTVTGLSSLLGTILEKSHQVTLLSLGMHPLLEKIKNRFDLKQVTDYEELKVSVNKWISSL